MNILSSQSTISVINRKFSYETNGVDFTNVGDARICCRITNLGNNSYISVVATIYDGTEVMSVHYVNFKTIGDHELGIGSGSFGANSKVKFDVEIKGQVTFDYDLITVNQGEAYDNTWR